MLKTSHSNSSGKGALFLILGVVVIVVVVLVIVTTVVRSPKETGPSEPEKGEMPELVHEVVIGDIKFNFIKAEDMGNTLKCEDRTSPPTICREEHDFTTTDKFIRVEITAQNIGLYDLRRGSWKTRELVDSEGRVFNSAGARRWIPEESDCGVLLKPLFQPTSCTEIYAVAERSIGLKVRVSGERDAFLDLDLYHEKYCWDDADCACGINKYTNDCFVGNKTYVVDSDPLVYPQELVERCDAFCSVGAEKSRAVCIENECRLY